MKSECVTSDQLYESMSSYQLKTKLWTKFLPKKALKWVKNFFSSTLPSLIVGGGDQLPIFDSFTIHFN